MGGFNFEVQLQVMMFYSASYNKALQMAFLSQGEGMGSKNWESSIQDVSLFFEAHWGQTQLTT